MHSGDGDAGLAMTFDELKDDHAAGILDENSLVRTDSMPDCVRIGEIPGLLDELSKDER